MEYTDIDEVYRIGSYKNSMKNRKNELVYDSQSETSSVISKGTSVVSSPNHTVVMGNLQEERERESVNEEPHGMNIGATAYQATNEDYLLLKNNQQKPKESEILGGSNLLESILQRVNLVLKKINNVSPKQRSQNEVYVHILLYFLTGLFILYVLNYVFNLGKQEIKITLAK